jgi:hypothetical protein
MAKRSRHPTFEVKFRGSGTMNYEQHKSSITLELDKPEDLNPIDALFTAGTLEVPITVNPSRQPDIDDESGKQEVMDGTDIKVTLPCTCLGINTRAEKVTANLRYDTTDVDMKLMGSIYGKTATIEVRRLGDCDEADDAA